MLILERLTTFDLEKKYLGRKSQFIGILKGLKNLSAEEKKEISEDEEFTQKKKVDELLDTFNRKVDEVSQEKKAQLEL